MTEKTLNMIHIQVPLYAKKVRNLIWFVCQLIKLRAKMLPIQKQEACEIDTFWMSPSSQLTNKARLSKLRLTVIMICCSIFMVYVSSLNCKKSFNSHGFLKSIKIAEHLVNLHSTCHNCESFKANMKTAYIIQQHC